MGEIGTRKYVGSAFSIQAARSASGCGSASKEHAGPAPQGRAPTTQWVKPGLIGRVKHLRGEEDLRHASPQDFREEDQTTAPPNKIRPEHCPKMAQLRCVFPCRYWFNSL
ncbi:hypothetical protein NKI54_35180 [Mesorhizobium sp. M0663]|uniref:hypothetical protein n=1 Tax=Mesorhizobium sp. M0663 TaxID=2956981 RepID=UPI00333C24A0